ncbi:putative efflux protein, MATE family [Dethiosulfatibacter aminovorans DSM 17477]|uniref:Putative efflux protein, MATE family n=1 Tax=Dethiosulfatibacter aminovorans DSM 17477 TaxID=1121476 RepID=A0A1M6L1L0_9FIRM|nr:MATE family efflux transporter [Dethiosulfatibacter aminovorans]SHJ65029.1 putative efflux protein, MATE family [Dethiosulfatibacter aminovorans DSM 17477]
MTRKTNKMGTMPVRQLVLSMSIPAIISMVIQALYNIVDSIYVSRIGEDALTAVSLAFPLQLLIIALVMGTGSGITSLISRRLGEHDRESATRAANHGFVINMAYSLIILLFGLFFAKQAVSVFTDDANLIDLTTSYISVVFVFSFGRFISQAGMSTLQATGDMIHPMKAMLIGAVTNIVLDPILIFGLLGMPELGIRGAAIATVTGQILSFVYIGIVMRNGKHEVEIDLKHFKPNARILKDIYVVALPAIIMQSLGSVMISGLNLILITFSSTAVAVLGVYYKLQSIVIMPVFGLVQGYMPIMGFNYGAKNKDRMVESLKVTVRFAFLIMVLGTAVMNIFPSQLLSLFDASSEMVEIGMGALKRMSLCLPMAAVGITFSITFQALGKGHISLIASFARQMIFILPFAWLLARLGGLDYVWYAFIIAEVLSMMIIGPWLMVDLGKIFKGWEHENNAKNEKFNEEDAVTY